MEVGLRTPIEIAIVAEAAASAALGGALVVSRRAARTSTAVPG
jgi:hypothetical protein